MIFEWKSRNKQAKAFNSELIFDNNLLFKQPVNDSHWVGHSGKKRNASKLRLDICYVPVIPVQFNIRYEQEIFVS